MVRKQLRTTEKENSRGEILKRTLRYQTNHYFNMETKRTVTDFFDKEYLEYAKYVVENRAIPHAIDGLKPTQRKVVYVANKIWKGGNGKANETFSIRWKGCIRGFLSSR